MDENQMPFDLSGLAALLSQLKHWIFDHVLVWESLAQVVALAVVFAAGWWLTRRLRAPLEGSKFWDLKIWERLPGDAPALVRPIAGILLAPFLVVVGLTFAEAFVAQQGFPHHLLSMARILTTAWIFIRLVTSLIRNQSLARSLAAAAWIVAALKIIGVLDAIVAVLDSFALTMGEVRISVMDVIMGVVMVAFLLWLASLVVRLGERRISRASSLTPSAQVLVVKLMRIGLMTAAIIIALNTVGIDLTGLAVFTGAVGLGIGFGLQKVFSNLISGVILLLDRSVKPGDTIAVGDTFGWINSLNARYVSLLTRDGTEFLIPNEELISQQVENWSHSNPDIRLKLPFGVSYDSDPHHVIEVVINAIAGVGRILTDPAPVCRVMAFGDSSVDFEVRVWIRDPQAGVANIRSELLLRIWDALKAEGIEIPFPQRELHFKEPISLAPAMADTEPDSAKKSGGEAG